MSQKRKHAELDRESQDSKIASKKHRSTSKPHKFKANKQSQSTALESKTLTINSLKNRIRDLKRLLEHVDNEPRHKMPANVRIERERELEACEHELAEKTTAVHEAHHKNKMISKYHQIRFFDRRKATRKLKQLERQLSSAHNESQKGELEREIHSAKVDLNYAQYYPLLKPYSALYPTSKRGKDKADNKEDTPDKQIGDPVEGPKGDPELWRAVEQAMEEGTLEMLRDTKADAGMPTPCAKKDKSVEKTKKDIKKDKKKARAEKAHRTTDDVNAVTQDEENDSDGGFFE